MVYRHKIRLDWRKTRGQYKYNDHDLTVKALNEELIHFVLLKAISDEASQEWDNLPRDMRIWLQE